MKKAFTLKNVLTILLLLGMEVGLGYLSRAIHFPVLMHFGVIVAAALFGLLPGLLFSIVASLFLLIGDQGALLNLATMMLASLAGRMLVPSQRLKAPIRYAIALAFLLLVYTFVDGAFGYMLRLGATYSSFHPEWFAAGGANASIGPYFLGGLCFGAIDASACLALTLLLSTFLPQKFLGDYPFRLFVLWERKGGKPGLSIQNKIGLVNALIITLVGVAVTAISTNAYHNEGIEAYSRLTQSYAIGARQLIDVSDVDAFVSDPSSSAHRDAAKRLDDFFANAGEEVSYLYAYKMVRDEAGSPYCFTVYDVEEGVAYGDMIPFDDYFLSFEQQLFDVKDTRTIGPVIGNDDYGWLMTFYLPLINESGEKVAYMCVDVDMTKVMADINEFGIKMAGTFTCLMLLSYAVLTAMIWVIVVRPIHTIQSRTEAFRSSSPLTWEESPAKAVLEAVKSKDEVGELYEVICRAETSICGSFREIQDQQARMKLLERNIIFALASMVESRDKNTGDHIQKTSFYVQLIVEELLRQGLYPDTVNQAYCENLVLAAPLHDVGKIAIPDAVLNKPGRLDEKEFALMRRHTVEGAAIIDMALQGISGSSYLDVARDVALYHHEKYDGSGYMAGLKGEQIPLSARIMAIADVFDALVSKRSYKEPFPYEHAIAIMKEGRGKHFDPKLLDIFLSQGIQAKVRKGLGLTSGGTDEGI